MAERGIVLTGGGALLRDIDKPLMEETGLPVVIAEDRSPAWRVAVVILELQDEVGPGSFGLDNVAVFGGGGRSLGGRGPSFGSASSAP